MNVQCTQMLSAIDYEVLEKRRTDLGMSYKHVACELGWGSVSAEHLFSNTMPMRVKMLDKLLRVLVLDAEEVIKDTNELAAFKHTVDRGQMAEDAEIYENAIINVPTYVKVEVFDDGYVGVYDADTLEFLMKAKTEDIDWVELPCRSHAKTVAKCKEMKDEKERYTGDPVCYTGDPVTSLTENEALFLVNSVVSAWMSEDKSYHAHLMRNAGYRALIAGELERQGLDKRDLLHRLERYTEKQAKALVNKLHHFWYRTPHGIPLERDKPVQYDTIKRLEEVFPHLR